MSVVIRCHNQTEFLVDAVTSAVAQSRPPDEIVIVDDGSDIPVGGPTLNLPVVRLRRNPVPSGPAGAANEGIIDSAGDYIVLLDADDLLTPTYLEQLEQALGADPAVDFAYAGSRLFGAVDHVQLARPFDVRELCRENFVNVSAMFRRALFERIGGFSPELDRVGYEDWDFWLRAVENGSRGVPVVGCMLEYRRHLGGSRNATPRRSVLHAHLTMRRRHPDLVRRSDVVAWAGRALRRTATGRSTR